MAHRKALDALRRAKTRTEKQSQLQYEAEALPAAPEPESPSEGAGYPDDRLRLIFTCCHPSLNQDAQVALTLRTLGGLSTPEIARAFLVPEATMAQRLVRAKNKIRQAGIPYQVPPLDQLPQRIESVRTALYLIFNEGYSATAGDGLIRSDLCAEAIRLARILVELLPEETESLGLLALMILQDSRRHTRTNAEGDLVVLEEQDRSRWNQAEITEGRGLLDRALGLRRVGPYQIQAAIAALHAEAKTAAVTDWAQIVRLYDQLLRFHPTPVVALNRAAAVAMSEGYERGLALVEDAGISEQLGEYHLFHAARADLLRRLGRREAAAAAYRRALELTTNRVERRYLRRRLAEVEAGLVDKVGFLP